MYRFTFLGILVLYALLLWAMLPGWRRRDEQDEQSTPTPTASGRRGVTADRRHQTA